jgi:penicillin-binding protein 1A
MVEGELTGVEFSHESWKALLSDYPNLSGFETGLVVSTGLPDELKKHSPPEEVEIESAMKLDGAEEIGLDNIGADQLEIDQRSLLKATVYLQGGDLVEVGLDSVEWAAPYINENAVGGRPKSVTDVLEVGHVVRFRRTKNGLLRLSQIPEVQGAIVAMDPTDGGISAMVGGFDFSLSNFNRTTQSKRQPGSSFKPFVYSAALEQGYTAATIVNDAPIVIDDPMLEDTWKPENYSGKFSGETRLREALVRSLNLVSVRVIRQAGVGNTVRHLRKFGFDDTALPANSSLALGSGGVAPVDLAAGYAVFANGGYAVNSHLIERIEDIEGKILYETSHPFVCRICEPLTEEQDFQLIHDPAELYPKGRIPARVISAQNAFLIRDMMADVVRRGTGRRAYRELGREDLAGKTGTSNERRDAWFAGFNGDLVAAVWVGFDQERSLGQLEEGGRTALPMWNYFMTEALKGLSDHVLERPPGIIDVRINPKTGLVSRAETAIIEQFRLGHVPQREDGSALLADSLVDAEREEREDTTKKPIF